jgi:hypothetical protein
VAIGGAGLAVEIAVECHRVDPAMLHYIFLLIPLFGVAGAAFAAAKMFAAAVYSLSDTRLVSFAGVREMA